MMLWLVPDADGSGMASASMCKPVSGGIGIDSGEVSERDDGKLGCVVTTPNGTWTVRALPVSMARRYMEREEQRD